MSGAEQYFTRSVPVLRCTAHNRFALDILSFEFNIASMSSRDHENSLLELFRLNFPAHGEGDESHTINADTSSGTTASVRSREMPNNKCRSKCNHIVVCGVSGFFFPKSLCQHLTEKRCCAWFAISSPAVGSEGQRS